MKNNCILYIISILLFFCVKISAQQTNFIDHKFSIDQLDLNFEKRIDTLKTEVGSIVYTNFWIQPDLKKDSLENFYYSFSHCTYPNYTVHSDSLELLKLFFKESIDAALSNTKGALNYEDDIEIQGFPGKIFRITFNDGGAVIKSKLVIANTDVYLLQVAATRNNALNNKMDKFVNSFKLLL